MSTKNMDESSAKVWESYLASNGSKSVSIMLLHLSAKVIDEHHGVMI